MSYFYLYKITNMLNNKIYIGITNNPKRRFKEHKYKYNNLMPISKAILKYGPDNFKFEVLLCVENKDDIHFYERANIKICRKLGIQLYNITDGGDGASGKIVSQYTKSLMSKKMSGENNHNFGKYFYDRSGIVVSDEAKAKIGKITKNIAIKIRNDYASGKFLQKELAEKYQLHPQNINRIVNNKIWK